MKLAISVQHDGKILMLEKHQGKYVSRWKAQLESKLKYHYIIIGSCVVILFIMWKLWEAELATTTKSTTVWTRISNTKAQRLHPENSSTFWSGTFLDLVSLKAFLRRFSSFSRSLTSESSSLLFEDLLV